MVHTGKCRGYHWLVSEAEIECLDELVLRFHPGLFVCVTACDSGPVRLSQDEVSRGWSTQGKVAISPPLSGSVDIPRDQYDKWYIFPFAEFPQPAPEIFVNYGRFTLVSSEDLYKTFDPPWPDWLTPIQERFWSQLERLNPESYIAMGDYDIVVTRNRDFFEAVRVSACSVR
jgi:hypothetical protein